LYDSLGKKISSVVEADHLITAGVSNWGAYGLVAQASIMVGSNLLSDWDEEEVLEAILRVGLIDGVRKKPSERVDGIKLSVHMKIVELLKAMVQETL
jgi:hypothetical protein